MINLPAAMAPLRPPHPSLCTPKCTPKCIHQHWLIKLCLHMGFCTVRVRWGTTRLQTWLDQNRNVCMVCAWIVTDRHTDRQAGRQAARQPADLAGEEEEGLDECATQAHRCKGVVCLQMDRQTYRQTDTSPG
jgi:hypothetical protein